ncbi:hypothetical protein NDU88_000378 [Pleurodeles waltl]|uniref:Uncharacterized protein n=1 Tax=Pleurodeles waltl TaxID=8319 RepID=A0AAV7VUI3_PLEWA|nr:hypothetical protein NDU88_000378 [Pleurodeles waltl]
MRALRRSGQELGRPPGAYPLTVAGPGGLRGRPACMLSILLGAGLPPGPGRSPLGPRLERRLRRLLGLSGATA